MRTSVLATLLGVSLVAGCQVGDFDDGGGDGDGGDNGGGVCGDGVTDSGETCDDGNTAAGDGCSASCETEALPRVMAVADKTTITTELGKVETVAINFTSVDGFAGEVTITPSVLDASSAPIAGLITVEGPASVALAADGTATASYTLTVPSDATGTDVAASLKFDVSSAAGAEALVVTANVGAIYTFTIAPGTAGSDAGHPATGKTVTLRRGTKLRMANTDTVEHITHGGNGLPHEGQTTGVDGLPGATYEVNTTAIAPGENRTFGCHTHGAATYASVTLL